jgi:transposase-like protein
MKKAPTSKPKLLPKMYCNIFGHEYQVTKKVTYHVKEYTCRHCKKELTTNSNGTLTELTPKFKEINAILERIHTTRMERLKRKSITSSIYSQLV